MATDTNGTRQTQSLLTPVFAAMGVGTIVGLILGVVIGLAIGNIAAGIGTGVLVALVAAAIFGVSTSARRG